MKLGKKITKNWSVLTAIFILTLAMVISGCGGKLFPDNTATKLAIVPDKCQVLTDGEQKFKAVIYNANNDVVEGQVNWSVSDPSKGEINADGLFKAGKTTGECKVICTSGNLKAEALVTITSALDPEKQIIKDTKTIFKKFSDASRVKYEQIAKEIGDEIAPNMTKLEKAIDESIKHGSDPEVFCELFRLKPGVYSVDDVKINSSNNKIDDQLYTGEWTVNFTDGWVTKIKRDVEGDTDKVTVTQTSSKDLKMLYTGKISYLTFYVKNTSLASTVKMTINMTIKDANIAEASCEGELTAHVDVENDKVVDANGTVKNGKFSLKYGTDGYLNLSGELSATSFMKDGFAFKGTLENKNLVITANEMNLKVVENANGIYGYYPSSASLNGSVKMKDDSLKLEGNLTATIGNAAKINTKLPYSATNFMNVKIGFNGDLETADKSILKIDLTAEELGYKKYKTDITYTTNTGSQDRTLKFSMDNSDDSNLHVVITSTYGDIVMDFNLKFEGVITNDKTKLLSATGDVKSKGVVVGTVTKDASGSLKITYTDGDYEIL